MTTLPLPPLVSCLFSAGSQRAQACSTWPASQGSVQVGGGRSVWVWGQMQEGATCQRGCYFRKGWEGKLSLSREGPGCIYQVHGKAFQGEGTA